MVEIFDNIKKVYHFTPAHPELASFIEWYSESSPEKTEHHTGGGAFSVKMFPSWTPTIWMNLGTSYRLVTREQDQLVAGGEDLLVLRDSITTRYNQPGDHIFTVKFLPGGLESILGINQRQMVGRVVPLQQILPADLIMRVRHAGDFTTRIQLLEGYFLGRRVTVKQKDHYLNLVSECIDAYKAGDMQFNTSQLAAKMFCSSKTINRYFNEAIGLSPKKYFSILRSRAALTAYVADRARFSPTDHGYYDMSHFYRESASFTGSRMGYK